jgi:hypothetical protein
MTKTAGCGDLRQRTRRKTTVSEKADSQREREAKKRKIDAELGEKNKATNKAKGWFPALAPALAPAACAHRNEADADQAGPLDMRDGSNNDNDDKDDDFQVHGKSPFHALITGTNKYREIRYRVLTVTDEHDHPSLQAMVDTLTR